MIAAVIENGVVTNIIEVKNLSSFPNLVDGTGANIGDKYENGTFVPQPRPVAVPLAVTMRQARLALLALGNLSRVDAIIALMPSPQKEAAQIEWNYAHEVRRDSPLVAAMQAAIPLTEAQTDALFVQAAML